MARQRPRTQVYSEARQEPRSRPAQQGSDHHAIALNMMDYNASGYDDYEHRCIKQMEVLTKLVDDTNPKAMLENMRLSICILSTMSCMRDNAHVLNRCSSAATRPAKSHHTFSRLTVVQCCSN